MDLPNKRLKPSPPEHSEPQDFVSLDFSADVENRFGYGKEESLPHSGQPPRGPRLVYQQHDRRVLQDRRHAQDKPKSKHILPGNASWILIRTKFGRRFVHNVQTKQSLWRIPADVLQSVIEFDELPTGGTVEVPGVKAAEKKLQSTNARSSVADEENRNQRRRSESLQREDEAALMAELARESEDVEEEEEDSKQVLDDEENQQPQAGEFGYDSEGSYEYVEVTDDEGQEADGSNKIADGVTDNPRAEAIDEHTEEPGPVEFGEDDIAYQLAAMGEEYGLDAGEYGDGEDYEEWEEGAEGLPFSDEDAANLFRDLLEDYRVSPFTPWDNLLADTSPASILNDDRFTVLTSSKARKEVWDAWVKEKAAQIRVERANMEKQDPRIPYLAFLAEKATPKLYWPEFKRKFKREGEMNDRNFTDKEREKLYREHVNRLKLPESTRKADIQNLLQATPLEVLNRSTTLETLPQQVLTNIHFISLPQKSRDVLVESHLRGLPPAPKAGGTGLETSAEQEKKRAQWTKREQAMAQRERQVEAERRNAEKEERFAKRELRQEEARLNQAMAVKSDSLQNLIGSNDQ